MVEKTLLLTEDAIGVAEKIRARALGRQVITLSPDPQTWQRLPELSSVSAWAACFSCGEFKADFSKAVDQVIKNRIASIRLLGSRLSENRPLHILTIGVDVREKTKIEHPFILGLRAISETLRREFFSTGVRVSFIHAKMPSVGERYSEDIADAALWVLAQPERVNIQEITLT